MIKRSLVTVIGLVLVAACGQAERENPLVGQNISAVGQWVNNKVDLQNPKRPVLLECAKFWASQTGTEISPSGSTTCNEIADWVAGELKGANFGDVRAEDVPYPPIWAAYIGYAQQTYDPSVLKNSIR